MYYHLSLQSNVRGLCIGDQSRQVDSKAVYELALVL